MLELIKEVLCRSVEMSGNMSYLFRPGTPFVNYDRVIDRDASLTLVQRRDPGPVCGTYPPRISP